MSAEAFQRRLALIRAAMRIDVNAEIRKQAGDLVSTMRSVARKDDGDLQASIVFEMQELRAFVRAGGKRTTRPVRNGASATYDYAMANEHGTEKMPAQPFFFPTYRLKRKQIRSGIQRAMKKAIAKAMG